VTDKEQIEKLLDCSDCGLKECITCEITYTDKKNIKEYIKQLEADSYETNNIINQYIEEIEKKDRIIDEIAKELESISGTCPLDMYLDTYWEKYNDCSKCKNTYAKCFKEYFTKKVEGN